MSPSRDENELAEALREIRPVPTAEFAAELDSRAAAGFPRGSERGSLLAGLRERLATTPPRRLLAPAGALALATVAIATAVVATTDIGDPTAPDRTLIDSGRLSAEPAEQTAVPGAAEAGAGEVGKSSAGGASSAAGSTGTESEFSGDAATAQSSPSPPQSGPYAAKAGRREIERSAEIVLATEPAEVRTAAAKVFEAIHAADGIVLSSSIRDGNAAVAEFELLIPSAKVGDALAAFSRVAEVRSRHEATADITAPTVTAAERLRDARAAVEGLLGQLAGADTDAERAAVEAQLRAERYRVATLRSRLASLRRRANLSRVSLRIETGSGSAADHGSGGAWGVGDGLDGAGRILAVGAGVAIIGLALLSPFALLALLAWVSRRAWLRHSRARALSRA